MDTGILKIVGQVAGIGGLALGVFLLLFRDVIRKNIFPNLNRQQGYKLLLLIIVLTWTIALAGMGAWVYVKTLENTPVVQKEKEHQLSGVVLDGQGKAISNVDVSVVGAPLRDQTTSSGSFLLKLRVTEGTTVRLQAYKEGYKPWNDNVVVPNTRLQIPLTIDVPAPAANNNANTGRQGSSSRKKSNQNDGSTSKPPVITDQSVNRSS